LTAVIEACRESGFIPVHLHELPALLRRADQKCKYVAFTLDDGYRNNLQFAAPVFEHYQVPYTIYPTIGFVERENTIWWETCQAILQSVKSFNFDFGRGLETLATSTSDERHRAFQRFAVFVDQNNEDDAVARIDELSRRHDIDPFSIVMELVMDKHELAQHALNPLVEIGAHSVSHVNLRHVSDERLQQEISGSI